MTMSTQCSVSGKIITLLLLASLSAPGTVLAASNVTTELAAPTSQKEPARSSIQENNSATTGNPDKLLSQLHRAIPQLDQALIIFASANGFIIACGLLLAFFKTRLHTQSTGTLASLRAGQRTTRDTTSAMRDSETA
ncbi:hypothetical protein [Kaarinaea lacus]